MLGTGSASVIAGGDYHATGATQFHDLGTKMEMNDGRIFRYVQADGTGFAAGLVISGPAPTTANHVNRSVTAASIGAKKVLVAIGATAAAENLYAGGYLWINDGTGEGHMYTISGHPAAAGSDDLTLSLAEPLAIALVASATTEASVVRNLWKAVTVAPAQASLTSRHMGVSAKAIVANEFGWLQTKGVASVLSSTTGPTVFQSLITGAAGTATVVTAATEHPIGFCINAETASGDQCLVYLTLD